MRKTTSGPFVGAYKLFLGTDDDASPALALAGKRASVNFGVLGLRGGRLCETGQCRDGRNGDTSGKFLCGQCSGSSSRRLGLKSRLSLQIAQASRIDPAPMRRAQLSDAKRKSDNGAACSSR
jgi:hypothetical protein